MMDTPVAGSFRDPAGQVFVRDGVVHRGVTPFGDAAYQQLISSGLYTALVDDQLLVPHDDLGPDPAGDFATLLRPRPVPMISYPYEWSLSQLRDAALTTLRAERLALRFGMTLKDATAFNVQFLDGRPILIDTLSFVPFTGGPWLAYRQFCQHFLTPLLLGATRDPHLVGLSRKFIDGVPLELGSRLLPTSTWLRPGPLMHVHLHAAADARWSRRRSMPPATTSALSAVPAHPATTAALADNRRGIEALVDSLERSVEHVRWRLASRWSGYYADGESYASDAFALKTAVVTRWLADLGADVVWDLGANTGHFSKLAASLGARIVAFDADAACVDTLYREVTVDARLRSVLPLVMDVCNPTPGTGWANSERASLQARGPADLVLALALIHHLAIANNVPLPSVASYLASLGRHAIVEFVPKSDPMVVQMLRGRDDVFPEYDSIAFERACARWFTIVEQIRLAPSARTLYLLRRR